MPDQAPPPGEEDHCPRKCGCGGQRVDCYHCGGEGEFDSYEDDPVNFEPGDVEPCEICGGRGWWRSCCSAGQEGAPP